MEDKDEPAFNLSTPVVGREHDLARLRQFVDGQGGACLVLTGDAGIGKTTLWEAGLELARQSGYQVLSARASLSEVALTFVVLADLVDGIAEADLDCLAAPQRRALDVTLSRADPVGAPPDPLAVSSGFLNALNVANRRVPVLVAIDDVQWLDAASAGLLIYAARRLDGAVRFLLTRRQGRKPELEQVLLTSGVEYVAVTGMSLGALGRILSDRLGINLSWRALRRVHEGAQGNPLFALELGRLLSEGGGRDLAEELPLPDLVEDVFRARIEEASEPVRHLLLAAALSGSVSQAELATLVDPLAIEDAVASGVVVREGSRVRPAHPMLAAAARKLASTSQRQELHLELASVAADPILKALHLAVATIRPDVERAASAATAADLAANRGRIVEAVQLSKHALRLTSATDPHRAERIFAVARMYLRVGEQQRMKDLLVSEMDDLPRGRWQALAHLLLHEGGVDVRTGDEHVEVALAEAGEEPDVRAWAFSARARDMAVRQVERVDEAARWATEAMEAARSAGPEMEDQVRPALAWARVLRGQSIDDLVSASESMAPGDTLNDSIARPLGVRFAFRGQIEEAKKLFGDLLLRAEERGELLFMGKIQLQLCEVELRGGHVGEAARLIDGLEELLIGDSTEDGRLTYVTRVRALMAAVRGDQVETVRWGQAALEHRSSLSGVTSPGWDWLEVERALGIAALADGDSSRAVEHLWKVWEHTRREHVDDPGAFPVAGDLVDALVGAQLYDLAQDVIERLSELSVEQSHPWGLVTAERGRSLLQLATSDRYLDDSAAGLAEAARSYGSLGLNFDQARSLLSLGVSQRRFKKWAAARTSLEQAAALFDEGGSSGWAHRARDELNRLSGRRSGPADQLTPTETRVVRLAASGMSNKEIARQLYVSVNTIEGHLSRAYAKLGVRSRAQLVHVLGEFVESEW